MGFAVALGGLLGLLNGFPITALNLHSLVLMIAMAGVYKGVNLVRPRASRSPTSLS